MSGVRHGNQPDRDLSDAGGAAIGDASPARAHPSEPDAALRRRVGGWALAALLKGNRSQVTWAESVGVSKSFAQRWLTGAQPLPVEALVRSVAEFPEVTIAVISQLAALVGMELRVTPTETSSADLATVIREALDVVRQASEGEADGFRSVEDCDRELREWEELDRVSDARKAQLRRDRAERGAVVRIGGGR